MSTDIRKMIDKINELNKTSLNENKETILTLDELKDKYPQITFNFKPSEKFQNSYIVSAEIKTQGGETEYLGALKGPVSKEEGLKFLNNIANKNYDKFY